MNTAQCWVEKFQMEKHPEGGYFKEMYRSEEKIAQSALPNRFGGDRNFGTAIYFLLESHHFSAFHRIQSDEIWHFYEGCPLTVYFIDFDGNLQIIRLGRNPEKEEVFQAVVPAGVWFGSKPTEENSYSLVGCTVAPGFDFDDFELAEREKLLKEFPEYQTIIEMLTH